MAVTNTGRTAAIHKTKTWTDRQIAGTKVEAGKQTDRPKKKKTKKNQRKINRLTSRHTGRQTDNQADSQT